MTQFCAPHLGKVLLVAAGFDVLVLYLAELAHFPELPVVEFLAVWDFVYFAGVSDVLGRALQIYHRLRPVKEDW